MSLTRIYNPKAFTGNISASNFANTTLDNITSLPNADTGVMKLVSSSTITSGTSSVEFTLGDKKEYKFFFVNIHLETDNQALQFNFSTDNGSNYNVTKTTTFFRAYHKESGSEATFLYAAGNDLAQSTSFQNISQGIDNDNDASLSGYMSVFNPSSTTFVKHFKSVCNTMHNGANTLNPYVAGYCNTTSAVTNIKFQSESGNIDDGKILMFSVE